MIEIAIAALFLLYIAAVVIVVWWNRHDPKFWCGVSPRELRRTLRQAVLIAVISIALLQCIPHDRPWGRELLAMAGLLTGIAVENLLDKMWPLKK